MTRGEKIIYNTIKSNINIFTSQGKGLVRWDDVEDKPMFQYALDSLTDKGFITHEVSFISVIVHLTVKGRKRIESGDTF